jgi:hypothetical protein
LDRGTKAAMGIFLDERRTSDNEALQMILAAVGGWPGVFANSHRGVRGMEYARIEWNADDLAF